MPTLDNIQINLDFEAVSRRLHLKRDNDLKNLHALVDAAHHMIEPKVLYEVKYIEEKLDNGVVVDGRRLISDVLRKNLDQVERVFPFVITIGNKFGHLRRHIRKIFSGYHRQCRFNPGAESVKRSFKTKICP